MLKALSSLKLGTRIIMATMLGILAVIGVSYTVFIQKFTDEAKAAMVERAGAFTAVADEAKNHVSKLAKAGAFNMTELSAELAEIRESGGDYKDARIFETIPVVAGWTAAEEAAQREHLEFHVVAFDARNKENEPEAGSFREKLLHDLEAQIKNRGAEFVSAVDTETNQMHYMRAIILGEECMICHGDPQTYDADKDGIDPVGFAMESWKPGDMHGAYEVVIPMSHVEEQVASFITGGLMWTVPIVVIAMGGFFFMLRVMFTKPVTGLIGRIRDIAEGEGDLTQRVDVKGKDELAQLSTWINTFIQKIHDIISVVKKSSGDVASAATEIAASSEEMAQSIAQQSSQVSQMASAVEEMSQSVVEVARKSGEAAGQAAESGKIAKEGGDVVHRTIEGMKSINEAVSASAGSVTELGKRGEEIGRIIGVINDIADQTNLLALNAAIEAARAGEHGRGFAVVADEVRKLADRTTKATEEIAGSIKAIQSETGTAVERMNSGTEEVKRGVESATEAGSSLGRIVDSAQAVASMIQSIAAAAEEQSATGEELSRSVNEINSLTSQTSTGASQAASAASELSGRAEQLMSLVGRFKVQG